MKLFEFGSKDIGIDLGTTNILITVKGRGIVLREPAVVAIDRRTEEILATGSEAKEMIGRTPEAIKAVKPIKHGVIADLTATELMLRNMLKKVYRKYNIKRPRVVVGVPSGITEVEERAVEDAIVQAGAKEVYLIEEPMAAAIGAGMHTEEPSGNMIIDIGGGTTEVAVIALGGIVTSNSIRIAGDELDQDIINYIKRKENLSIGETTAEEIKVEIGCVTPPVSEMSIQIRGRDLSTGLPRDVIVKSSQVLEATSESIKKIVDTVKMTLEKTPPELSADLVEKGIVISGGGALIKNIDQLLSNVTNMPVYIVDDPLDGVVRGTGKTLEHIEKLKSTAVKTKRRR